MQTKFLQAYIFFTSLHIKIMIFFTAFMIVLTLTLAPVYFRIAVLIDINNVYALLKVRLGHITLLRQRFTLKDGKIVYKGTLNGIAPIEFKPDDDGVNLVRCFDLHKLDYRIVFAVDKPSRTTVAMAVNILSAITTAIATSVTETSVRGGTSYSYDENVTVAECLVSTAVIRILYALVRQGVKNGLQNK